MAVSIQFEVPTWNQIYEMMLAQAQKIQTSKFHPDIIIGVARGGLIPSRILADLLEIHDVAVIAVEYYVDIGKTLQEPVLKQCLAATLTGKRVLLVDDVSDCGKSLKLAKEHLQTQGAVEIKVATLYSKPGTITKPNYFEKETSCWIVFPWEYRETIRKILQKSDVKRVASQEAAKLASAGFPKHLTQKFLKEMI
jgi:hypoxanthine phosphoribosyltransferase